MIEGYYYLHTNDSLKYKREFDDLAADLRESDFVRMFWPFDSNSRSTVWRILVEASALGANAERIQDLVALWQVDDEDAPHYANELGVQLFRDGDQWCATRADFENLQESPAGFGYTALKAFAELAKALDYRASKMWGATFSDLCGARKLPARPPETKDHRAIMEGGG